MHFKKISLGLSILIFFLVLPSFQSAKYHTPDQILTIISDQYHNDLDELKSAIATYKSKISLYTHDEKSLESLQNAHITTRYAFKKVEYLMEYYDPSGIKQLINGAPLPKVEQKVADLNVLEPKGLQVLDEIVFSEDVADVAKSLNLIIDLESAYEGMRNYHHRIKLSHRHIFEAARQEIIRVATLGITGFDTPGSANGLRESKVALESTWIAINHYIHLLQPIDTDLSLLIIDLFTKSTSYLEENDDFDNFDRLHFIREILNPLYGFLYDAQISLNIETSQETNNLSPPINYEARSIFSRDFLNVHYYSSIDNDSLQEKRLALGKILFYDPVLSQSLNMSCATCHDPRKSFTDGLTKSISTDGGSQLRNAPTLLNAVFAEKYFLDLREEFFDRQMNHVVTSHQEFNTDFIEIMGRLQQSEEYMNIITEAYPTYGLSQHAVTNSISTYVESLVTLNSPFDQYINMKTDEYNAAAKSGFNLFMGKAACGTCHFAPIFNGLVPPQYRESESEILGVPATSDTLFPTLDSDLGRIANSMPLDEAEIYQHSFKTTTVRNSELTAPYMHNGVYNTLEEVMDFYNKGGGIGLGLDVPFQTIPFDNLNLTEKEQQDIIAFIKTLTDAPTEAINIVLPSFENHPEWNNRTTIFDY